MRIDPLSQDFHYGFLATIDCAARQTAQSDVVACFFAASGILAHANPG